VALLDNFSRITKTKARLIAPHLSAYQTLLVLYTVLGDILAFCFTYTLKNHA